MSVELQDRVPVAGTDSLPPTTTLISDISVAMINDGRGVYLRSPGYNPSNTNYTWTRTASESVTDIKCKGNYSRGFAHFMILVLVLQICIGTCETLA